MEIVGKNDLGVLLLGLGIVYFMSKKKAPVINGDYIPFDPWMMNGNGFIEEEDSDEEMVEQKEPFVSKKTGVVSPGMYTRPTHGKIAEVTRRAGIDLYLR